MSRFKPPYTSQHKGCFCCPGPVQLSPLNVSADIREMRGEDGVFPTDDINNTLNRLSLSQYKPNSVISNANDSQLPHGHIDPSSLNSLMQNIHINNQSGANDNSIDTSGISFPLLQDHGVSPVENTLFNPSGISPSPPADAQMSFMSLQSRQLGGRIPPNRSYLSTSAPSVQTRAGDDNSSCVPPSANMDIDLALDELGMLSTVTKSRKDFLLEMRGSSSAFKREKRLRSKSESSPNLSSLSRVNGLRIVQVDSNFVANVSSSSSSSIGLPSQSSFPVCDLATPLVRSQSVRMEYRNPDELEASSLARRRRSVPRMSRIRSGRYNRSSRCPYKVPNRLCNSMHEGDFNLEGFQNNQDVFSSSSSLSDPSRDQTIPAAISLGLNVVNKDDSPVSFITSSLSSSLSSPSQHHVLSKSNTNSPVKPCQDQPLVRSLSVEDLHSVPARKLALLFDVQARSKQREEDEAHFEQIASQFTDLHMS